MPRAAVFEPFETRRDALARSHFDFQAVVVKARAVPGFGYLNKRCDYRPKLLHVADAEKARTGEPDRRPMRSPDADEHEHGQVPVERT